jgi:CheY-like chemotaxis protein
LKPVSRPRVVCVDDDASIRRFVELALEDLPVELLTCADATTARELLRQGPVALLITDLMMPGESGFELLASLMADPALRGGALLAVFSAGLNATTRARASSKGTPAEVAACRQWSQKHSPSRKSSWGVRPRPSFSWWKPWENPMNSGVSNSIRSGA